MVLSGWEHVCVLYADTLEDDCLKEVTMRDYEISGSGIRDPVAAAAIQEADRQPEEVSRAIRIIKFTARCHGLEVENRICLVDKETGERWP